MQEKIGGSETFGGVRTTRRMTYTLPIHLLGCLLAYSLYNSLIV